MERGKGSDEALYFCFKARTQDRVSLSPKIIRGTRQICASLYSSPQVILESIIGFISIFRGNEAVAMSIICYIIFNRGEVCSMHNKTPLLTVTHDILSDNTPGNIMAVMEVDRLILCVQCGCGEGSRKCQKLACVK